MALEAELGRPGLRRSEETTQSSQPGYQGVEEGRGGREDPGGRQKCLNIGPPVWT